MSRRMVVLLVDALGWELATGTSGFAAGLTCRRRLETILGFSSGALPTIFTGRMPSDHGRWLMYRRRSGDSPFAGFEAGVSPADSRGWSPVAGCAGTSTSTKCRGRSSRASTCRSAATCSRRAGSRSIRCGTRSHVAV